MLLKLIIYQFLVPFNYSSISRLLRELPELPWKWWKRKADQFFSSWSGCCSLKFINYLRKTSNIFCLNPIRAKQKQYWHWMWKYFFICEPGKPLYLIIGNQEFWYFIVWSEIKPVQENTWNYLKKMITWEGTRLSEQEGRPGDLKPVNPTFRMIWWIVL